MPRALLHVGQGLRAEGTGGLDQQHVGPGATSAGVLVVDVRRRGIVWVVSDQLNVGALDEVLEAFGSWASRSRC